MRFNKLIPELYVSNINKSIDFYKRLGFKIEYERKEDKFVFLSLEGSQIMVQEQETEWQTGKLEYPYGRGVNFQIDVKNIEEIYNKAKKIGKIKIELQENSYKVIEKTIKCKEFLIQDQDGYLLRFSQDL